MSGAPAADLEVLLFDVDGTLADTEELHREAFNEAFRRAGLDWEWSVPHYRDLLAVAGGRERIRYFLEQTDPARLQRPDADAWIAALHADKTRIYNARVAAGEVALRPGVRRLLEEARAEGLRLGIATTTSRVNVETLLRNCLGPDAPAWFEVIAAGECVTRKKPAPDVYARALERFGVGAERCLAIEDAEKGVQSALAAGVPVVVTHSPYTEHEDFSGALLVVDHLGEPDRPMRVLQGSAYGKAFVDVALLRRLCAEAGVPVQG